MNPWEKDGKSVKVLMTGGGTGGHVYPAVAIANTIKNNLIDAEIAFVGTPRGIENKICKTEGYPIYHVDVRGMDRSNPLKNFRSLYLAAVSPRRAMAVLEAFRPDIVIGTGGYVSWPIMKAAVKAGIPTVLHESNVYPGLTVRQLQDQVDRILLNFAETADYLKKVDPENLLCVGNPLRTGFETMTKEAARKRLNLPDNVRVLLSYGGSRGAQRVNETVVELMKRFDRSHPEVLHIHATGDIGAESFRAKFKEAGLHQCENIRLYSYINDMPAAMAAADLVICRAGAMTISEIAMTRKPAIFIPSPNVAENHQYKNAKLLADHGAAVVLEEKNLSPERLQREVESLLFNGDVLRSMSALVGDFANPNANRLIYDEVIKLVNSHLS